MVPGVATLDRGPDHSQRVRPISHSHRELREPGGGPSWVEYRSGGTGDPHPGMDILSDLSPRAKALLWGKVQPRVALPCHYYLLQSRKGNVLQEHSKTYITRYK